MKLKTWIKASVGRNKWLAERLHTSPSYLSQLASGVPCSAAMAVEIEKATCGEVRCDELHPAVDWSYLRGTAKVVSSVSSSAPSA
ncbi:transcriptional regulator [Chitinibacter sp. S2-10]|uniref:transcriptional regulator n=1 Tax=Chitinibacter sp. S2-10 TaxID=3373597 RepID=UPI003977395D